MGHSDLDPAVHERRPWNAGQNVGPKRPLKPQSAPNILTTEIITIIPNSGIESEHVDCMISSTCADSG